MKYEPLTPEKFSEKLKEGHYESLTGARRAIGKATWNDAQRDKARKVAEAHFGTEGSPKKPAAKKAAKSEEPKKRGPKPKAAAAAAEGTPKRGPGRPRRVPAPPVADLRADLDSVEEHVHAGARVTTSDIQKNPFQVMQIANNAVQSGNSVLQALTDAKRQQPTLNTDVAHHQAIETIESALRLTSTVVNKIFEGMNVPEAIRETLSHPVNGVVVPDEDVTPGQTAYQAPAATA